MKPHDYLDHRDLLEHLTEEVGRTPWLTVYMIQDKGRERLTYYSVLAPVHYAEKILEKYEWDCMIDFGKPGINSAYEGGVETDRYNPFGTRDGFEPIVIGRFFG